MDKIIEMFEEIKKSMDAEIKDSLQVYYVYMYDPVTEYLMERELKKLVHQRMEEMWPDFPKEFLPQFRIKIQDSSHVEMQIQSFFNDLKGWRYIGTLTMPFDIDIYDIYIRTNVGIEPFELMTKFNHDRNSVFIGGQKAVYEYSQEAATPLAYAYDYAVHEGEL